MVIIPLNEGTLDMIEELNNGVRPAKEEGVHAYFVYNGKDEPPEIISIEEFVKRRYDCSTRGTIYIVR